MEGEAEQGSNAKDVTKWRGEVLIRMLGWELQISSGTNILQNVPTRRC